MQLIELDDYTLHSLIETVPSNVHRGLSGLASAEDRVETGTVAGDHGAYVTSALAGGRIISIEGRLRGSESDFPVLRQVFIAATSNKRDTNGRVVPRLLKLYDLDGRDYQVGVVRRTLNFAHELPTTAEWRLELFAPDPWIYAQEMTTASIALPTGGGFLVPVLVPIAFGNATGGSVVVTNEGTATTKPTIEIHGPVMNPVTTNETTGRRIGLNLSLRAGEVVTLDMQARTAIQGGSTNRMGAITTGSSWWGLQTGENTIRFAADTYDAGTVEVILTPRGWAFSVPIFVVDGSGQYVVDSDGRYVIARSPHNPTALIDPDTLDQFDDTLYTLEIVSPAGVLIADITRITRSFTYTLRRNRAEAITLEVDLGAARDLASDLGLTIWDLFAGYINEIRIRRGNRYLLGGQLIYAEPSLSASGKGLSVRASGFLDLFSSRFLLPVAGVDGGKTVFTTTDIGQIIWSMIQTTQALLNGNFGVTLGAIQPSRTMTDSWQPFATSLSDIFQALTERITSVDIAFSYDKKLYVYFPGMGTDKPELRMGYPGNITGISLPRDWTRTVNYSINRGSGNGSDVTPVQTRQSTDSQLAYRIRMHIDDYPDVSVPATLNDYGDEALRLNGAGQTIPQVSLNGRLEPELGAYWLGDTVRFAVEDEGFALLDGRSWRINEISVSVDDGHNEDIKLQVGYS